MTYDPGSNPRYLGESVSEDVSLTSSLNAEIERWGMIVDTFQSEGWRFIRSQLETELERANVALRRGRFKSLDDLNLVRGQVMGYEQLLKLPHVARGAHRRLTEQLEAHFEEVDHG